MPTTGRYLLGAVALIAIGIWSATRSWPELRMVQILSPLVWGLLAGALVGRASAARRAGAAASAAAAASSPVDASRTSMR